MRARTPDPADETSTHAESGQRLLGEAPTEDDPLAIAVARARVAGALFGGAAAPEVGRFRVLERLGAGGMGVVYTAYDPDLDRAVALKLVRVSAARQGEALQEAKALARLAHPNVVPVHDVGVLDQHVYIVMELVRGETLAAWARKAPRTAREIVRAYLQAGAALAAAHRAGLVHRDFKPDNAILGEDGRVRVVDFGLACEAAAEGTSEGTRDERVRIAGTPAYMAPEQKAGRPPTPAADQYSFCAALHRALTMKRDGKKSAPPRWIAAILARGRAEAPGDRYPSMNDLLRALAHDPVRTWARRGAAAAVAVGVVGAFFLGRGDRAAAVDACGGAGATMAAAWGPEGRDGAIARLERGSAYGRSAAASLAPAFTSWEGRWIEQHRGACLAHQRGEQSDAMLDRRMACLDRAEAAYGAVAEAARAASPEQIAALVPATAALPDPARCGDLDALLAEPAPRPEIAARVAELRASLARARALTDAARFEEAGRETAAAIARARPLGEPRVLAEALLIDGALKLAVERPAAIAPLDEATNLALSAGADAIAVEAWARRAYARATSTSLAGAASGHEIIEALAQRPDATPFTRTLLFNNLGTVALSGGDRDDARRWFTRALDESRGLAAPDLGFAATVRKNLALVDPDHADALLAEAIASQRARLGGDHPDTLTSVSTRGALTTDLARAFEDLSLACEKLTTLHPTLAQAALESCAELGAVALALGDEDHAREALARAAHARDVGRTGTLRAVPDYLLHQGKPREAEAGYRAALPSAKPDDPWWLRCERARIEAGLGEARRALGAPREAEPPLARAVATLADVAASHPIAPVERWLALARTQLALTRKDLHRVDPETRAIAESAAAYLRRAGSRSPNIAALEQLSR